MCWPCGIESAFCFGETESLVKMQEPRQEEHNFGLLADESASAFACSKGFVASWPPADLAAMQRSRLSSQNSARKTRSVDPFDTDARYS